MPITVDIHDAKKHLSRLVDEAARGQEFIIAKAGKPKPAGHWQPLRGRKTGMRLHRCRRVTGPATACTDRQRDTPAASCFSLLERGAQRRRPRQRG